MKRALVLLLTLLIAAPQFAADERVEKKRLVAELLEVLDVKAMAQAQFDAFVATFAHIQDVGETPEQAAARSTDTEEIRTFREHLFRHLDYGKLADDVYAPLFDERFTTDELRELIVFFKTKQGQKVAKLIPELGLGARLETMKILDEAANAAQEEIEKEANAKSPWKKTLADLRTLATALEARATDMNEYPNVSFDELEPLLSPTYVRTMPKIDSWGTPYIYAADGEHYRFVSAGADRRFEWDSRRVDPSMEESKTSESLDADIIYQDGTFLQYPKEADEHGGA